MSKGGGKVDTSAQKAALYKQMQVADQEIAVSKQLQGLAGSTFDQGQNMYQRYEAPILEQYRQILGLDPATNNQYTDPAMNRMMQAGLHEGQQAAGAASKNLMNMGLGPIATQTGKQQIDLTRMGNAQNTAYKNIQTMITQMLQAGQQGTGLQGTGMGALGNSGQLLGQAGGQFGSAARGFGDIAQLEAQAAQAGNFSLMSGLKTIGSIAGTLGGFFIGGPAGAAAGAALAGGGGSLIGQSNAYTPSAIGFG